MLFVYRCINYIARTIFNFVVSCNSIYLDKSSNVLINIYFEVSATTSKMLNSLAVLSIYVLQIQLFRLQHYIKPKYKVCPSL